MPVVTPIDQLNTLLPQLAAEARVRGPAFEAARRLAPDFAGKLKQAGLIRLLVPQQAGGMGCSLPEWLELMMQLAEADASTAWVAAHGSICSGLIYASADARFRDEFFADPLAYASWSNLPRVEVREQDDGLRISGVLERLLREASCLTHHISANLASYELTGRVRSGVDALHLRV